ncbi:TetR family transcriptional regulator [Proteiniclasticum sp. C24MP]|uniref:TetR family transcriptional regulator n=1 Tax=Proteiniclasticum sp. C24MP TaxID=3374101 RepID=UPI003754F27A
MNKREAILWAAVDLMGENGFSKTSVSQIVKKAGVAQGTFYLYFQSKSELVLGIASHIIEDILKEAQALPLHEETPLKEFISLLTDLMYEMTLKHKKLIGFIYSGTAYYSSFKEWENLYIPFYAWLTEKLSFYREKNLILKSFDLSYLSNFIIGLLEHGAEQVYLMETENFQETRSKEQLKTFIYEAITS